MPVLSHTYRRTAVLISMVFMLLTACSSSSDPATVAADFSAYGVKGTVSGQNVTVDLSGLVNCSTNINNMVLDVQAAGASISPDPRSARDYSAPVEFTLIMPDGTKVVYKVTVKGAVCLTGTPTPTPTPTPTACTAAPIIATEKYSLVFKGCDSANMAQYYDKTECVRDNTTGLIWQGQTGAGTGLRANDQFKSNYDSTTALQKYNGSVFVAPTQADIDAITNSIGFKNAVNTSNLCGSSAWRLPTKDELLVLVKDSEFPTIDNAWFPNTLDSRYYWTSTPFAGVDYNAWFVWFNHANALEGGRGGFGSEFDGLVRLVR
ncbi:MAG TPA: DUF1566 domain-containing protein [Burkholderiaceae bacterium]|nr:DUF1566 domain-containing protein [Burkholderiaceae bacterium]